MRDAIAAMRLGLGDDRQVPVRSLVGSSLFMPGRAGANTGVKVVSTVPGQPAGLVLVMDEEGGPWGIVDGPTLTSIRTGAAAGLATELLARPDASRLAILGAGAMAGDQVAAVAAVRTLSEVRVWSRDLTRASHLASDLQNTGLNAIAVSTPGAAVEGADVITTVTPSRQPLFEDRAVSAGSHINAIGAFMPDMVEIPAETVERAYVVIDDWLAAGAEAGDLIQAGRDAVCTIADVLAGRHPQIGEEVTMFKSVGIASQDVAAGASALRHAERLGLGVRV